VSQEGGESHGGRKKFQIQKAVTGKQRVLLVGAVTSSNRNTGGITIDEAIGIVGWKPKGIVIREKGERNFSRGRLIGLSGTSWGGQPFIGLIMSSMQKKRIESVADMDRKKGEARFNPHRSRIHRKHGEP